MPKAPLVYPESVPLPEPEEFGKKSYFKSYDVNGIPTCPSCLMGWVLWTFLPPPENTHVPNQYLINGTAVSKALVEAIHSHQPHKSFGLNDIEIIICFNDHPNTTHKQRAAVWADAMKRLGYTETYYTDE